MLLPFSGAYVENPPEPKSAPEVVSIDDLTHDAIEAAEAELEQEENKWPATA